MVAIRAGSSVADPSGAAERAFEAALRRAGVLCVTRLEDLLAAAEILARARPVRSEALSIVTNAISAGRMAADAVLRDGLQLATDIVHVEPGRRLARLAGARASAAAADARRRRRPGGACAKSGEVDQPAIAALAAVARRNEGAAAGLCHGRDDRRRRIGAAWPRPAWPVFATPEQAVRGFLHLVQDRRNRAAARELPPGTVLTVAPDRDAVRDVFAVDAARRAARHDAGRGAGGAVRLWHSGGAEPRAAASPEDAAEAATLLGFPAVVKLRQSVRPDARASGGLALDLHDAGGGHCRRPAACRATAMPARVARCWCSARRPAGASCGSG